MTSRMTSVFAALSQRSRSADRSWGLLAQAALPVTVHATNPARVPVIRCASFIAFPFLQKCCVASKNRNKTDRPVSASDISREVKYSRAARFLEENPVRKLTMAMLVCSVLFLALLGYFF